MNPSETKSVYVIYNPLIKKYYYHADTNVGFTDKIRGAEKYETRETAEMVMQGECGTRLGIDARILEIHHITRIFIDDDREK